MKNDNNDKMSFEEPEIIVIRFDKLNIITTSTKNEQKSDMDLPGMGVD